MMRQRVSPGLRAHTHPQPQPKENLSPEMKRRLRDEYVGFGGTPNKVSLLVVSVQAECSIVERQGFGPQGTSYTQKSSIRSLCLGGCLKGGGAHKVALARLHGLPAEDLRADTRAKFARCPTPRCCAGHGQQLLSVDKCCHFSAGGGQQNHGRYLSTLTSVSTHQEEHRPAFCATDTEP